LSQLGFLRCASARISSDRNAKARSRILAFCICSLVVLGRSAEPPRSTVFASVPTPTSEAAKPAQQPAGPPAKGGAGQNPGKPPQAKRLNPDASFRKMFLPPPKLSVVQGRPTVTVLQKQEHFELRHFSNVVVDGHPIPEADIVHLNGVAGIQGAAAQGLLPDAVRDALLAHAKQLKPGEASTYIVNKQAAEEWAKTHSPLPKATPLPPVKSKPRAASLRGGARVLPAAYSPPIDGGFHPQLPQLPSADDFRKKAQDAAGDVSKGAQHAAGEVTKGVQHAGEQVSGAFQHAAGQGGAWAKHWQQEATKDWEKVEDCWADHPLSASKSLTFHPQPDLGYTIDLASLKLGRGTVSFQLPLELKMQAEASVFYIPCMTAFSGDVPLPFVVRPRDVSVQDGYVSVSGSVTANIQQLAYHGDIPIDTQPVIPVLPPTVVMAGPVPIEFAVYAYLRGKIKVDGEAAIGSNFVASVKAENTLKDGPFWFVCDGHGCRSDFSKIRRASTSSTQQVPQPNRGGRLVVEPKFWAAVQIDLYNGILMGRAGPEPAISGDLWGFEGSGCGGPGSMANPTNQANSSDLKALAADIDAKIYSAWQVGALGMTNPFNGEYIKGANGYETPVNEGLLWMTHLFFDPVESSGLSPAVGGTTQVTAGKPAAFRVRMNPCYPYSDSLEYRVKWTGSVRTATTQPLPGTGVRQFGAVQRLSNTGNSQCTWQADQGICRGDPRKDTVLNLVWAQPGNYTLTVEPVQDQHGRKFPGRATQLNISAGQASTASTSKH
jgi:hypothetical protein